MAMNFNNEILKEAHPINPTLIEKRKVLPSSTLKEKKNNSFLTFYWTRETEACRSCSKTKVHYFT